MLRVHRAHWVLPMVGPPIRDGWVSVDGGLIAGVGSPATLPANARTEGLPHDAILPGLVNAHTHLELSWMSGRIPSSPSMGRWIRALMALRLDAAPPDDVQRQAAAAALREARARGTVAFGDISNTLLSAEVLGDAGVPAVLFHELIGFRPDDAVGRAAEGASRVARAVRAPVRPALSPHAPYSVSPELFRAVMHEADERGWVSSVHLAESREEVDFLMTGCGEIANTLKHLGAWHEAWSPPAVDPAEYLDRLGVLRAGLLVVHATQLSGAALARLATRRCVIVSCPRSNRWVGAGDPPIDAFYASGATVAFGTDSLASAPDLDMFAELAAARAVSTVPARQLLASATRSGAEALGLGRELGTIEPGKRAELLAVRVPEDVEDVEEYLVSGVRAEDVTWIDGSVSR